MIFSCLKRLYAAGQDVIVLKGGRRGRERLTFDFFEGRIDRVRAEWTSDLFQREKSFRFLVLRQVDLDRRHGMGQMGGSSEGGGAGGKGRGSERPRRARVLT